MKNLQQKFEKEVIKILGCRKKDGACAFCGESLTQSEYCDCKKAGEMNHYFKKFGKINGRYFDYINLGHSLNQAQKDCKGFYKTPLLFAGKDFSDYKTENDSERKCLKAVQDYCKNALTNFAYGTNLILVGNFGTGKTMLMSILCNDLRESWLFENRFINAVDLKSEITNTFSKDIGESTLKVINKYKTANWLFLDDIDKLTPTEYVKEFMYAIVNYRIENQLPTVVSSNHSLEELDKLFFGEAVVSRLVSQKSPVVNFTHNNRRFQ